MNTVFLINIDVKDSDYFWKGCAIKYAPFGFFNNNRFGVEGNDYLTEFNNQLQHPCNLSSF
ncbi:MAG: hypothetical protein A3D44_03175 [Candidatus Staskawiczbacteria bacterium RIFCSPHIGHO2_02_FULL_42_22]|uniref:Uncharacterized protein n=1 Tax=Candidatus Staskawiczbacteria bacterium RIFCSPHIGHO2_02_FULL_42_22 TaxID=1802207 RepID=A0A1G2I563_9BACT|nr:MAG: hypothetical protein A3D44_03175 [Candidatus Staskawiczbacteria bacterium RIFCSPHIGHO2_02_FULL_42_22]